MFGLEKVRDFRFEQTRYKKRGMSLGIRDDEKNLGRRLECYTWIGMSLLYSPGIRPRKPVFGIYFPIQIIAIVPSSVFFPPRRLYTLEAGLRSC